MITTTDAELKQLRDFAKSEEDPHLVLGVIILEELQEIQRLLRQNNAAKVGRGRDQKGDPERAGGRRGGAGGESEHADQVRGALNGFH